MKSAAFPCILSLVLVTQWSYAQQEEKVKVWKERGGEVIIEAEHLEDRNQMPVFWKRSTVIDGYHGTGYVEWIGLEKNYLTIPYDSVYKDRILTYFVEIKQGGVYYVKLVGYHEKGVGDNEVYVSVKEGEWQTFRIHQHDQFTCDNNEKKESYPFFLQYGYHKIELIGKRKGFKLDRVVLVHEDNVPQTWNQLENDCWDNDNESPNEYVVRDYF